ERAGLDPRSPHVEKLGSMGDVISYPEATKGHTIKLYNPSFKDAWGIHPWKVWKLECTCGEWSTDRPKVERVGDKGKITKHLMPMADWRALGAMHLYDVWRKAQQGVLT